MALFNFRLVHPDHITPWGADGNRSLHWFGLTDGEYWIETGDATLYEYSPQALDEFESPAEKKFVDYQVTRFVEDFFHALPAIHIPLSDQLYETGRTVNQLMAYFQKVNHWVQQQSDEQTLTDEFIDQQGTLISWSGSRCVSAMQLVNGPHIWFFRNKDRISIIWNTDGTTQQGAPLWSASSGQLEMTYSDFVEEVENFTKQFFDAMDQQVKVALEKDWKDVKIDLSNLQLEQKQRREKCEAVLARLKQNAEAEDWPGTEQLIAELL